MINVYVNGVMYKDVHDIDFSIHGFRSITQTTYGSTKFEGFYNSRYFLIEQSHDYGIDTWTLLKGEFSEEEEEILIDWITDHSQHKDDKVYQKWVKAISI